MRKAGFCLLFVGFLLCISIAWAAIGFLAMSLGLICLQIGERRGRRTETPPESGVPHEIKTDPIAPTVPPLPDAKVPSDREYASQIREQWRLRAQADSEIARVEKVLAKFGSQYVDQLAKVYLIFDRRALLPEILNLIIASAKEDAPSVSKVSPVTPSVALAESEVASGQIVSSSLADLSLTRNATSNEPGVKNGRKSPQAGRQIERPPETASDRGPSTSATQEVRLVISGDETANLKDIFKSLSSRKA